MTAMPLPRAKPPTASTSVRPTLRWMVGHSSIKVQPITDGAGIR
jgi:hypothetical protein